MTGPVERSVREAVAPGQVLPTLSGTATFKVAEYTAEHMIFLLGNKEARTRIPWAALEGVPDFLRGRTVTIGGGYDKAGQPDTFDAYLKAFVYRATSGWVAVMLEEAGVIEVDRTRPARMRLSTATPATGSSTDA